VHVLDLAAYKGLIHLNRAREKASARSHRFADTVKHKPSRLLSDADGPGNLARANAILAIADHPKGAHPLIKAERRVLENRAHFEAELLLAAFAKPDVAGLDERVLLRAATGARNLAIGPTKVQGIFEAAVGIAEVNNRVLQCLRGVHVVIMRLFGLCVKYIFTPTGNTSQSLSASSWYQTDCFS
jgi:hypothetical protein